MKNVLLFSVLFIAFFVSCQKDDDQDQNFDPIVTDHSKEKGNKIDTVVATVHRVFPTPLKVRSINYIFKGSEPTHCQSIPSPEDSIATIAIDINNDSTYDFKLTAQHWVYQGQGSGWFDNPCWKYDNKRIQIQGFDSTAKYQAFKNNKVGIFVSGDTIWQSGNFLTSNNIIYLNSRQQQYGQTPGRNNFYVGFELKINNEPILGWMLIELIGNNGIQVKESGINTKPNSIIIAGN